MVHPGCVVIPAAWSVARREGLRGHAMLKAVLWGFEAATRVGMAVGPVSYTHPDVYKRQGIVLLKFWLHITPEEQLRRFKEREQIPYKAWKLTEEDWRNRERWADYELAVNDMVEHTSTQKEPWTLIEANDKRYARIKVLHTTVSYTHLDVYKRQDKGTADKA